MKSAPSSLLPFLLSSVFSTFVFACKDAKSEAPKTESPSTNAVQTPMPLSTVKPSPTPSAVLTELKKPESKPSGKTAFTPVSRPETDFDKLKENQTKFAEGLSFSCKVTEVGGVQCGGGNSHGELGNNDTYPIDSFVDVFEMTSGVQSVVAGWYHACALTKLGAVKCWGANQTGQVGNHSYEKARKPEEVIGLNKGVASIFAGDFYTCALTTEGSVKCWGDNRDGQLGVPNITHSNTPVTPVGLEQGVKALAVKKSHTCAVKTEGSVLCWGSNEQGVLGTKDYGGILEVPTLVPDLETNVIAVSTALWHSCVVTKAGTVKCWGSNSFGQLGVGYQLNSSGPVKVEGLPAEVTDIVSDMTDTCVRSKDQGVFCWGIWIPNP